MAPTTGDTVAEAEEAPRPKRPVRPVRLTRRQKALRKRIIKLLAKHNPTKIATKDQLFEKYAGKEAELLDRLRRKYGPGAKKAAASEEPPSEEPPSAATGDAAAAAAVHHLRGGGSADVVADDVLEGDAN